MFKKGRLDHFLKKEQRRKVLKKLSFFMKTQK